jgi:hypothetical protein
MKMCVAKRLVIESDSLEWRVAFEEYKNQYSKCLFIKGKYLGLIGYWGHESVHLINNNFNRVIF